MASQLSRANGLTIFSGDPSSGVAAKEIIDEILVTVTKCAETNQSVTGHSFRRTSKEVGAPHVIAAHDSSDWLTMNFPHVRHHSCQPQLQEHLTADNASSKPFASFSTFSHS